MIATIALFVSTYAVSPSRTEAAPPPSTANQTIFGPNVYVFDPSMPTADIQAVTSAVFNEQESNEFSNQRYALLFKPGNYNIDMKVGFFTHVAGLGQNPGQVNLTGGALNVDAKWDNGNATRNFWRAIENLSISPSSGMTRIAVSQAAPLRRLNINGELQLFDFDNNWNAGWASGGLLADSVVNGTIVPGSQQQWFSRNSQYGNWTNGVWNMVFVGDTNPPAGQFPDPPYTVVEQAPVLREKPYLYIDGAGQYRVFVPSLQHDRKGVSWVNGSTPGESLSIDTFHIARPETATAASINAALSQGKNLIFTPGIYHLSETIQVNRANTVILGIGLPTLIPANGQVTMKVADVDGVKVAGLVLDAGPVNSASLLEVGPSGSNASHAANPTSLHDLFFRIGGAAIGKNDASLTINSNHVIGDHFWIWRADHGAGVGWTDNISKNGLVVNGDQVTIYGLFNEHHHEYQTLWNGNGGRVYFYQSEIPYDVPNQAGWMSQNGTVNGYASYKVADHVTDHEVWGLGVYSFFRDAPVKLESGIEVPDTAGVKVHHATSIWLAGTPGSEITHVINKLGGRVYANSPAEGMRQTVNEFIGTGTGGPGGPGGVETALDRTGWTASSSPSSGDAAANLLDGSMATRWSAGTAMAPGQSLTIDMKAAKSFNKIVMDSTGSNDDYARGFEVYVSSDGINYGSAVASGTGSGPVVEAVFPAQSARYIKIVQTGTASNWWSIRELNVYTNGSGGNTGGGTGAELSRLGWIAASTPSSGDAAANLLDGDMSTRWSTGAAMAPGQSLTVDMGSPKSFSKIVMDSTGSNDDYARGYEVYVSQDGVNYGSVIASGTGSGPVVTAQFSQVSARYLKIVQTGTASNWWSIRELKVYN
ncbi:fibronectin type III domain-containing protein [Paenibacillus pinisoli]|uniref:Fibronectin type III domain-containing protein n=2 Tax=Paenibacillus pinisoli TaxID=1276110 RepID=A0A3A6PYK5_9BACL|nr:discoidin domain-containing protein [Paenibacillus pinisoli]RJX40403.1 fibronectin type III domain-containing protein [Paenibacillus pinisoli]